MNLATKMCLHATGKERINERDLVFVKCHIELGFPGAVFEQSEFIWWQGLIQEQDYLFLEIFQ